MPTVAYLTNLFPSAVEPYVTDEIEELRSRGIRVIACSVRRPKPERRGAIMPEIVVQSFSVLVAVRALWLCLRKWPRISYLIWRIAFHGTEGPFQRLKALLHTWMGACYAVLLEEYRVEHIHVHHGYFGSWIALVAARLLQVDFSLTLHGSDLLVRAAYLDVKLRACSFCLTISEFNRRYILEHYPTLPPEKVLMSRLGVDVPARAALPIPEPLQERALKLLSVGRLQTVKNHAFLIQACAELRKCGVEFECSIAGDGPERRRLSKLIRDCAVSSKVKLLGHVPREQMDALYESADVAVLTSHSEGIPLVLMEAMAHGKIVLAPAITGIPELVVPGKTGFLYQAGSLPEFIDRLIFIRSLLQVRPGIHSSNLISAARQLNWVRYAAQVQVRQNFNRNTILKSFADIFLSRIVPPNETAPHANFVLQQI
jgi:colanic acid/amylovoran biosynthesis glycosyltransferase